MGRRSRKRGGAAEPRGTAERAAAVRTPEIAAPQEPRRRARLDEAPKAPWSPFPLTELCIFIALVLLVAAGVVESVNEAFAKNIVNRYWGYMMGRGIVEPVDDIRVTNPPSNPELLDALAKDFVANGFDVKKLLRRILTSEVYQLSSNPTPENKQDEVFYSKYSVKRMGAEELLDAVNAATGSTEKFPNLPAGMRAVQLPDPKVQNYFLDTFGRPLREIACECERSAEPNMAQALHLMNSDFVQNKVAAKTGRVGKLLEAKKPDEEIVQELYLATVSRPATAEESARALQGVSQAPNKTEGFEDLLWALLNSREFMFKH